MASRAASTSIVVLGFFMLVVRSFHMVRTGLSPEHATAKGGIDWSLCPDSANTDASNTFHCATLDVPLNWMDTSKIGTRASIMLRKFAIDKKKKKGTLIVNPGGPGGSGTSMLYRAGRALQILSGDQFDVVSFDPRGVNLTSPSLSTHPTAQARGIFDIQYPSYSLSHSPTSFVNISDPVVFGEELRRMSTFGAKSDLVVDLLRQRNTEEELKSLSTSFVARDVAALVDALGEGGSINYLGYSYGTVLGAHFAALFPHKVGRMVLDGVAHSGDFTSRVSNLALSSVDSSDDVLEELSRRCAQAGHEACPLAVGKGLDSASATRAVRKRIDELWEQLFREPLIVRGASPRLIRASEFSETLFGMLYRPSGWPAFASAVSSALEGNGTALAAMLPSNVPGSTTDEMDNVFHRKMSSVNDNFVGCMCSDQGMDGWERDREHGLEAWVRFGRDYRERSAATGDGWMSRLQACRSWNTEPFERYSGPWTQAEGLRDLSHPILFVGNRFDPVTPLSSARRMADGFGAKNAALLTHEGSGHCSTAQPSLCSAKVVREYFLTGALPETGTSCHPEDEAIFHSSSSNEPSSIQSLTDRPEELALWEAMKLVQEERIDLW